MPTHSDPSPRVTFTTPDHGDAARVRAVLEALGFDVVRVVPDDEFNDEDVLDRATDRLGARFRLSYLELNIARWILEGLGEPEIVSAAGQVHGLNKRALKWATRSLCAKLGLDNGDRAGLDALVDGLKDQREGTSFAARRLSEGLTKQVHAQVWRAAQPLGVHFPRPFETLSRLVTYTARVADRVEQVMSERGESDA